MTKEFSLADVAMIHVGVRVLFPLEAIPIPHRYFDTQPTARWRNDIQGVRLFSEDKPADVSHLIGDLADAHFHLSYMYWHERVRGRGYDLQYFFVHERSLRRSVMDPAQAAPLVQALDQLLHDHLWQYRIYRNPLVWQSEIIPDAYGYSIPILGRHDREKRVRSADAESGYMYVPEDPASTLRLKEDTVAVVEL